MKIIWTKEIKSSIKGDIGLPEEIYTKKPAKASDFQYSRKLDLLKEPENIIEELNVIYKRIVSFINMISNGHEVVKSENWKCKYRGELLARLI